MQKTNEDYYRPKGLDLMKKKDFGSALQPGDMIRHRLSKSSGVIIRATTNEFIVHWANPHLHSERVSEHVLERIPEPEPWPQVFAAVATWACCGYTAISFLVFFGRWVFGK